ncbi:unnamed protein product [Caenorhabditis auriculariae]|uniref:N-acetylgalactosaminide beta-1,3-galactosyltransferase n=1 Tax=Caenorhabditis auriculariae TaxID=2777116 RepID=A0A8S1HT60_9PELO|nr:unnamed protein product [Caenorhabditis auriculariae]
MCMIHTATPSHKTRAKTIFETWASRCDGLLFFTNSPMEPEIPHVYWSHLGTRDHSWEKIRRVFQHAVEKERPYDWYLRADDDAYVIVENLRSFLSNYSPKAKHFFGYRWNFFVPRGFVDGAAYILSRPAAEAFHDVMKDPTRCPEHHRAEEDQEMAKCLAAVGIFPEDSRDENGSDRFHHFHPLEHLDMFSDAFARRFAYYPPLRGEENFSPEMVSFHHVSPYEMRLLDFILYAAKPS